MIRCRAVHVTPLRDESAVLMGHALEDRPSLSASHGRDEPHGRHDNMCSAPNALNVCVVSSNDVGSVNEKPRLSRFPNSPYGVVKGPAHIACRHQAAEGVNHVAHDELRFRSQGACR